MLWYAYSDLVYLRPEMQKQLIDPAVKSQRGDLEVNQTILSSATHTRCRAGAVRRQTGKLQRGDRSLLLGIKEQGRVFKISNSVCVHVHVWVSGGVCV